MKVAFVFPGQGAQYVGMGRQLFDNYPEARQIFKTADQCLDQKITRICFEGPDDELKKTENAQPAILTVSIAAAAVIAKNEIKPDMLAGFSLGEYSALVFSGALTFEEALKLVRQRAILMQQAVPIGEGAMAVIIGLDAGTVRECCSLAYDCGVVEISNYNSKTQITVSGHVKAVEKACDQARKSGARQIVKLPVSAPFHSSLLKGAGDELFKHIKQIDLKLPQIPLISNILAMPYTMEDNMPRLLSEHVSQAIRWEECVLYMVSQGIDTFVEIGPGKVLSGLIKKISANVKTLNVDDCISLKYVMEQLDRGAA